MAPESDTVRPKCAAKEAALKNHVWLTNRKVPTSVSMSGKKSAIIHLTGHPPAPKKHASLSKAAKSGNHVTMQPPVNAKAKTHPPGNSVIPPHVQIDVNAESDDNSGNEDSDQPESDEGQAMQPESDGEDVSSEDQDNLYNLGPKDVRTAFEREHAKWGINNDPLPSLKRAKWGIDADVNNESDTNAAGDNDALSDDENHNKDKSMEVPKWDNPGDSDGTHTGTGTPFSSDGEDDNNTEQIPTHKYMVNKSWAPACHYVPTDHAFVNRFFWDHEIGKALGWVLSGHVSTYHGQLKRIAAGPECIERVRELIWGLVYVYPTKEVGCSLVDSASFTNKYFDLSPEHRDAHSPNGTIHNILSGMVFRKLIILECIPQPVPGWYRAMDFVAPGPGKLQLVYTPQGSGEPTTLSVYDFKGKGVALAMYNMDDVSLITTFLLTTQWWTVDCWFAVRQ
ncbi:hypothetical protein EDB86DRAFT_2831359 [Lactarius hatsudake]|nr:hypothetical protein EDB86DRAFT_2831359 [Lactarius hatsudake]